MIVGLFQEGFLAGGGPQAESDKGRTRTGVSSGQKLGFSF